MSTSARRRVESSPSPRLRRRRPLRAAAAATPALLALAAFGATESRAADLFWDANGAALGAGTTPTGTWGVDNFWNDQPAGGAGTFGGWVADSTANFSAGADATGAYTVTVSGPQSVAGINFQEGSTTLNGGEIDLSGVATINVAAGATPTLGTTIFGGSSRMTVVGPGTLRMTNIDTTNNNTFTGGVTVDGGKLIFGGEVNAASGSVNPLGAKPAATDPAYITLRNGGILSNTSATAANPDDANIPTDPTANFVLNTRGITIEAGGGTLDVADPNAKLVLGSAINTPNGDKWTKSGPGQLRNNFNGQLFTGGFKVTGGVYIFSNFEASSDGAGASRGSGIVPAAYTPDYVVLDGGTIKYPITTAGSTFIHPFKGITLGPNGGGLMLDDPTLNTGITNVFPHIAVPVGQTATLFKKGIGEVRANRVNTSTAWVPWEQTKLQVDQGFFRIGNLGEENGFGAVPATYLPDAIRLVGTGADHASGQAAIGITCEILNRPVTVTPATRGIFVDTFGGTLITSLGTGTWQIDSIISGPGGITLNGNGFPVTPAGVFGTATSTVDLRGANSYAGPTKINIATLVATGGSAIPDTSAVIIEPTAATTANLRIDANETIGSLAGGNATNGQVLLNGGNLTTGANNSSTTFSGVIANGTGGTGALIKTGGGTFTLDGGNTFTGPTTVNGGLLVYNTTASSSSTASVTANANAGVGDNASSLDGPFLAKINASATPSVGGLALAPVNAAAAVDFTAAPLSSAGTAGMSVGAIGAINYTGTITPNPAVGYRLGSPGGTLTLANANALTGARNVTVTNLGNVVLANANDYTGTTTVDAGSALHLAANLTSSPTVTINGLVELTTGGGSNRALKTQNLTVGSAGKLNIQDNKVIVTAPGATAAVTALIQAGRGTGSWNGARGIVTSQTHATLGSLTSIGVATASQVKGIATGATATWGGQTVTGSDTLVMYTYGGDANLDGLINIDDYGHIDTSVGLINTGWFNGDFNYDGQINIDDYGIIDVNVGVQSLGTFPTAGGAGELGAGVTAVPEPAGLSILALLAGGLIAGRRRRPTQPSL